MPSDGFSIKPLKVKLLAGEQKATETSSPSNVATASFEDGFCYPEEVWLRRRHSQWHRFNLPPPWAYGWLVAMVAFASFSHLDWHVGMGQNFTTRGPQGLVHVSTYQGTPILGTLV